jgi:hypothetical protein
MTCRQTLAANEGKIRELILVCSQLVFIRVQNMPGYIWMTVGFPHYARERNLRHQLSRFFFRCGDRRRGRRIAREQRPAFAQYKLQPRSGSL